MVRYLEFVSLEGTDGVHRPPCTGGGAHPISVLLRPRSAIYFMLTYAIPMTRNNEGLLEGQAEHAWGGSRQVASRAGCVGSRACCRNRGIGEGGCSSRNSSSSRVKGGGGELCRVCIFPFIFKNIFFTNVTLFLLRSPSGSLLYTFFLQFSAQWYT